MKQRLIWIDYAKALCIVLVVYGHVIRGLNSAEIGFDPVLFAALDRLIYGFHMPVFFLLSGYFVSRWLDRDFGLAIKQKVALLLVPYVVWSIIQGTVNVVLSSYTNSPLTWGQLLSDVFLNPFGQFWFVYVLFFIYLLSYLLKRTTGFALLFISLLLYGVSPLMDVWVLEKIFRFFIFFCLGILASKVQLSEIEKALNSPWYTISGIGLFIGFNFLYITYFAENLLTFLLAALLGINTIMISAYYLSKLNITILNEVGKMTMVIYLSHILFTAGTRIMLDVFFNLSNIFMLAMIGTIAGLAGPVVLYAVAKKLHIHKLLFGEFKAGRNGRIKLRFNELMEKTNAKLR